MLVESRPGTNRLRMCNNFTENCVICILSVNSNFQVHATSLQMMYIHVMPKSLLEVELVLA